MDGKGGILTGSMQRAVQNGGDMLRFLQWIREQPYPFTVKVSPGVNRRLSQNALFHAWMGQIGEYAGQDPGEVKADCHIQWGIPTLRAADPDYNEFIRATLSGKPVAAVKPMLIKGFIPCTSLMTTKTLSQYMDCVWRAYAPHVNLMDPEGLKWRTNQ